MVTANESPVPNGGGDKTIPHHVSLPQSKYLPNIAMGEGHINGSKNYELDYELEGVINGNLGS